MLDISAAYPAEAGIQRWTRTTSLNRKTSTVEVASRYQLTQQPQRLDEVFMTICQVDISKPGIILLEGKEGRKMQLTYDTRQWFPELDQPSFEGMEYNSFRTKWDGRNITRILLRHKAPKQKGEHRFTFLPLKNL